MSDLSPAYLAEDDSASLLEMSISFLVLETLFMILLWTSRYLSKDQKANLSMTLLMTAGYFTCVGKITVGILMVKIGGAGRHMSTLTLPEISHTLKLQTALQIVCPLTTSLAKLGILSLLYQILGRTSTTSRVVIRFTFALVLIIMLIQFIIPFANCKPFSDTWSTSMTAQESCAFPGLSLWRYLSIPNIVTTVITISIPLPALYKLQVSRLTKLGLGLVFSVCLMGMVAAIMRFYAFLAVTDFHDISYQSVTPLCWTIAESGIYLVAGVMPTLRPLVRKAVGNGRWEKVLSRTSWGTGSGSGRSKRGGRMLPYREIHLAEKGGAMSEKSEMEGKEIHSGRTSRNEDVEKALI